VPPKPSLVGIYGLAVSPGPEEDQHQSIQLKYDFLHLLLTVGMPQPTIPFTLMLYPTYVAATLPV
jgi:hypothetical protein